MPNTVYLRYMQRMTLKSVQKDVALRIVPHTLKCDRVHTSHCPDYGMDFRCSGGKSVASFGGE